MSAPDTNMLYGEMPQTTPPTPQAQPRAKVLVVDDTPMNLAMLMHVLSDKYAAIPARDGFTALNKANSMPQPDIILLDILMPDLDGFEVCKRLKANAATRDIPIIFLTAVSDQESELHGLRLGAVDYIRKPISPPLVRARLATHLELARSRQVLAEQNKALEEVVRLRDDIERITRHDLKSPLSAMIGFSELVLEEAHLSDSHTQCLQGTIQTGNRILEMINRSLDLYKMETNRYKHRPKSFDLAKVAHRVCHDLSTLAKQYSVTIALTVNGAITSSSGFTLDAKISCPVVADATLCYSMLANLVKNGVEAAPKETVIRLSMDQQNDGGVSMEVRNQGEVPEEIRDRFFDKYSTSGKSNGTGLGTYSAWLMVHAHGGNITMDSDPDLGTTVTIVLPKGRVSSTSIT